MNRNDFKDWQSYPITKALYQALELRIRELEDELGRTAGSDSLNDSKRVGAIQAIRDIMDVDWFEETQE